MKHLIIFVLMLFILSEGYSQMRYSKIVFKNGDTLSAKGLILSDYFKYKKDKKWIEVPFSTIDYVNTRNDNGSIETYKEFKIKGTEKSKVLKELIKGEVSLYLHSENLSSSNGFGSGMVYHGYIYLEYLKRKGEDEVIGIRDNRYFKINFKKAAALYFKDCPELVENINNKKFKRRHIEKIVSFYNSQCYKTINN